MVPSLSKSPLRILFLTFNIMDTLDFAGPFEVLASPNRVCATAETPGPFTTQAVTGATAFITTSQGATIGTEMLLADALDKLSGFDILVVPGGRREVMVSLATNGPELELVKAFASLPAKPDGTVRTILSICTGSFLLAGAGILDGMKATTHHQVFDAMQEFANSRGTTELVKHRFVVGGVTANRMRVITSGGISSGLDGSLYLLELICGVQAARMVEVVLEHKWRRDEGLFPGQQIV